MKFENRVAVITGAAGRIGRATAELLAQYGVALALADIAPEKLNVLVDELREKGANVRGYMVNVRDMENVKTFADQVLADFGKIDILVNNAGVMYCQGIAETSERMLRIIMMVHMNTPLLLCRSRTAATHRATAAMSFS
mgnify:CR=1 FL=1